MPAAPGRGQVQHVFVAPSAERASLVQALLCEQLGTSGWHPATASGLIGTASATPLMASDRVVPWRAKASADVTDRLLQVANVQLYLVQRLGPTSFVVREENSDVKRKVVIGSRMACSW